jgi:hypothetical protein
MQALGDSGSAQGPQGERRHGGVRLQHGSHEVPALSETASGGRGPWRGGCVEQQAATPVPRSQFAATVFRALCASLGSVLACMRSRAPVPASVSTDASRVPTTPRRRGISLPLPRRRSVISCLRIVYLLRFPLQPAQPIVDGGRGGTEFAWNQEG